MNHTSHVGAMPKKQISKTEAYLFIAFWYVAGLVFLAIGRLDVGVLMIGIGFLWTVIAIPEVLQALKTLASGIATIIGRQADKRRASIQSSARTTSESLLSYEHGVSVASEKVKDIVSRIQEFKPYKKATSEREIEYMLMQYLKTFYPSLRTQLQYERTQIDGQVGGIGVEIKYEPREDELDRLFGQVEKYLRHLEYVIVVIGYERSPESTEEFRKRLSRQNWESRVTVVTIP